MLYATKGKRLSSICSLTVSSLARSRIMFCTDVGQIGQIELVWDGGERSTGSVKKLLEKVKLLHTEGLLSMVQFITYSKKEIKLYMKIVNQMKCEWFRNHLVC